MCVCVLQVCGVSTTGTWCWGSLCTRWWTTAWSERRWSAGGGGSRPSRTKRSVWTQSTVFWVTCVAALSPKPKPKEQNRRRFGHWLQHTWESLPQPILSLVATCITSWCVDKVLSEHHPQVNSDTITCYHWTRFPAGIFPAGVWFCFLGEQLSQSVCPLSRLVSNLSIHQINLDQQSPELFVPSLSALMREFCC